MLRQGKGKGLEEEKETGKMEGWVREKEGEKREREKRAEWIEKGRK